MQPTSQPIFRHRNGRKRQGGFNFAEVLFAVMILGIGFIMVAAIFPVALMQSKSTQEETTAASVARGAANFLEQLANNATMPATNGEVHALDWRADVRGAMLLGSDSRYAWVPFYRRSGTPAPGNAAQPDWASSAQVYMLPIAVRNRSAFDKGLPVTVAQQRNVAADPGASPPFPAFTQEGVPALVATITDATDTTNNATGVDIIEFTAAAGLNDTDANYTAVAEGAYVIVANVPGAFATGQRERIGHIFRIGNPTEVQPAGATYPRRWELAPGNDYIPRGVDTTIPPNGTVDITPLQLVSANVFVVGRALADPSSAYSATANPREGRGQDVAAYTTFVNIR